MPRPVIKGKNDLASQYPEIARTWDKELNGNLSPEQVAGKSNRPYHWICDKGHRWEVSAATRAAGNGCPYCSNQRILPGENDLASLNPELAKEWNYEKNGDLLPTMVGVHSTKKVWWKCKNNHEWQAMVSSRNAGCGCAVCSNRRILAGENDLFTKYPALKNEWDYEKNKGIDPQKLGPSSKKKVGWICQKGHKYDAPPGIRTRGHGCPYCANQKPIVGENDFKTVYPELAKEWDYEKNKLRPEDYTSVSGQRVYWKCKKGHSYQASIAHRVNGTSCPICAGKIIIPGVNDLAKERPDLAEEWDFTKNTLKPTEVGLGSNKSIAWICPIGHSYSAVVYSRVNGTGCPYCAGRKVLKGFNDLETKCPDLAKEWHPTKNGDKHPDQFTYGSHSKAWWICPECRNEWYAQIKSRVNGNGCAACSQSHLEKYTEQYLAENGYDYKKQVKFKDLKGYGEGLLSYDFGIKEHGRYKTLIECQGIQHYEASEFFGGEEQFAKQKLHDELKQEYAKKKGINLIEIPYTCDTYEKVAGLIKELL